MAVARVRRDDEHVLSPSWPVRDRLPRRLSSPEVRRRVQAAQRRGLRAAVAAGGMVIAAAVALDGAFAGLVLGDAGRALAIIRAAELVAIGLVVWLTMRRPVPPEAAAMGLVLLVYAVSLVRLAMLPEMAVLSVTYLAVAIVGSGLFLPWSSRWHAGWLALAIALTALATIVRPAIVEPIGGPGLLVTSLAVAALASFFGHRLWQVRWRDMLHQQFALREMSRYAKRQETNVMALNLELNRVARRDALTGVGNRLALGEALARLLDQGDRVRPRRFALVLFDIDHFKRYNDDHGHLAGDAALGRLGEVLRRATRGDDLAFRYGGEEFLLLLPDVDLPGALGVAERVRTAVIEQRSRHLPPFTITGGVALCDPADGADPEPLLRRADAALYEAKRAGRNRVAADPLSVAMQRETLASAG